MRFDVITLFPELFGPHLTLGVTRRAYESAQLDVKLWPLRDFADNAYRRVDDRPYGGGPGTVLGDVAFEANGQAKHKHTIFKVVDGKTAKIEVMK